METKDLEVLIDSTHKTDTTENYTAEDAKLLLGEALRRMYISNKNERQLQIFAMYVLKKMEREYVARYFSETPDYISLTRTRLYPKFLAYLKEVEREDYEGHLKLSDKSLAFLSQILPVA